MRGRGARPRGLPYLTFPSRIVKYLPRKHPLFHCSGKSVGPSPAASPHPHPNPAPSALLLKMWEPHPHPLEHLQRQDPRKTPGENKAPSLKAALSMVLEDSSVHRPLVVSLQMKDFKGERAMCSLLGKGSAAPLLCTCVNTRSDDQSERWHTTLLCSKKIILTLGFKKK